MKIDNQPANYALFTTRLRLAIDKFEWAMRDKKKEEAEKQLKILGDSHQHLREFLDKTS